ncbi:MAG TPA: cation-translocating P-type ATPase, partial [Chitinophagaceae bacterium]|nr:cation-translocating P-type ATPase [Chitinophagaceae bacterium]
MINEKGLSGSQVIRLQEQFGKNRYALEKVRTVWQMIWEIGREPMFILLEIACALYFVLGDVNEGIMMALAMVLVAAISVFQDARSSRAMQALREFTEPRVRVIRDGQETVLETAELVPGDLIVLEEGNKVPADAIVLQANDLSVNESIITGESLPLDKKATEGQNLLYQGTTINTGQCLARVTETGNRTVLGKLGKAISTYSYPKTLLQKQIGRFVRLLAFLGLSAFVVIWLVNYLESRSLVQSLMAGLTLALAAIPEEIPVAFSSFMALGAMYMGRRGLISRQPQTIENLGAVSVICLDKTGTITENRMQVREVYDFRQDRLLDLERDHPEGGVSVMDFALLASERNPFDPMEVAIREACASLQPEQDLDTMPMVHEYPLAGSPPMMTHVYDGGQVRVVAAKGAMERILRVCRPEPEAAFRITQLARTMASRGYRVIAVASATHTGENMPADQDDFTWQFEGLVSLYDPPRKNVSAVLNQFYSAGIRVKLLTGDFPETAAEIARQVHMRGPDTIFTGEQVMAMGPEQLARVAAEANLFARMFPEAKLRVIEALKASGEIVAMTGDGVNDGPALKSANIGIALGKRGTEIARQAADLILTDDNIARIEEAILQGRKIFSNLKKAVRYIISIHIPILLTASLPLLLGWRLPNIFTPIHIIFLELIMGPTCSIFFEREPVEPTIMRQPPRDRREGLFTKGELLVSILQGLLISAGVLGVYYFAMQRGDSLLPTRTVVFTTLILANIFLTFTNRSFQLTLVSTVRYPNNLTGWVLILSVGFLAAIHRVPLVRDLFGMTPIPAGEFLRCLAVATASVFW